MGIGTIPSQLWLDTVYGSGIILVSKEPLPWVGHLTNKKSPSEKLYAPPPQRGGRGVGWPGFSDGSRFGNGVARFYFWHPSGAYNRTTRSGHAAGAAQGPPAPTYPDREYAMSHTTTSVALATEENSDLNKVATAFVNADKAGKAAIKNTLQASALEALQAGNMELAAHWAGLMRDVVSAAEGVASDYEAAQRVASFRAVMADLEVNLSDRARDLLETGTVGPNDHLVARLNGIQVTRTAVSTDGAKRAASDEPKGSVKDALVAYLATQPVDKWSSITEAGKWITSNGAEFGYTPNYVISGGAILARNNANPRAQAWRDENNVEFAKVDMGKDAPIWCVKRSA